MTILAVFKSRAQTLDFISRLSHAGVPAQAVSTPKDAGVGCGISAKFDARFFPRAKAVLSARPYSSFAGFLNLRS
ncbi:MAG: DUF3343 domain-containing protein [Clostridia bacterium]|nr:DUF3343 domain-containing protein [Clostridia bacterium]MDE7296504.1 DUF3343 domain-containing protein [Clostridia bacterium]